MFKVIFIILAMGLSGWIGYVLSDVPGGLILSMIIGFVLGMFAQQFGSMMDGDY